jgi:hypothetical protein
VTRRRAKKAGDKGLPRRFELGVTPVVRTAAPGSTPAAAGAAMADRTQEQPS